MQLRAAVGGCLRREARESRWLVVARGQTSLCPRQKERFGPRVGRPRHVFIANVGEMADEFMYVWHERPVPAGLEIRQVYGYLLCPQTARVLIQDVGEGKFNLPGGTPEVFDADMTATLAREAMEESQVLVTKAAYLGYQEVRRGAEPPFAQVRMAGLIDRFEPRAPDPDGGRLFRRFMSSLDDAPAVLGWGEPAVAQAAAAARAAAELWGLPVAAPAAAGYADLPGAVIAHGAFSRMNALMVAA
jgi:8-oxo-dGTP pyrophosphatase MutT (NUDIX family)